MKSNNFLVPSAIIACGLGVVVGWALPHEQTTNHVKSDQNIIAQTSAGNVTSAQVLHQMTGSQLARNSAINTVDHYLLVKEYGDKVSQAKANAYYHDHLKKNGEAWLNAQTENGYTTSAARESVRDDLIYRYVVKKEYPPTTHQIEAGWKAKQSHIEVTQVLIDSKALAKRFIGELNKGKDFKTTVQKYANNLEMPATSSSLDINTENPSSDVDYSVMQKAKKLHKGQYSAEPIELGGTYAIIRVDRKYSEESFSDNTGNVKNTIIAEKAKDTNEQRKILKKLFKKYKVKLVNKDFHKYVLPKNQ